MLEGVATMARFKQTLQHGAVAETTEATIVDASIEPGADPRIGLTLSDRYRVVRWLGRGGVGAVYEGEHLLIKRKVAIKFLHPHYATDPKTVARFHQEAISVSAIGHPNIVEALDRGTAPDGTSYLVFEYLDGHDMGDEIHARGALPVADVVRIAMQVCDALEAAHAAGLVHRDLKPENIFLVRTASGAPRVKLLDFGISKLIGPESGLTNEGTLVGTPYYLSPEQASAKLVDHRADLYALGVVLYVALTGRLPFDADSIPALLLKICTDSPPPLRRDDAPAPLAALVRRLLANRPDQHPANAAEVRAALEAALVANADPAAHASGHETADELAPVEPPPEVPSSSRAMVAGVIAAAMALIASAAVVLWPSTRDETPWVARERGESDDSPSAPSVGGATPDVTADRAEPIRTLEPIVRPAAARSDVAMDREDRPQLDGRAPSLDRSERIDERGSAPTGRPNARPARSERTATPRRSAQPNDPPLVTPTEETNRPTEPASPPAAPTQSAPPAGLKRIVL